MIQVISKNINKNYIFMQKLYIIIYKLNIILNQI
jgi:hypothetical protein